MIVTNPNMITPGYEVDFGPVPNTDVVTLDKTTDGRDPEPLDTLPANNNSCLMTAQRLVNGPRRDDYGPVESSFTNYAIMWSVILGKAVTPLQVALCMDALKTCREIHNHKLDSLVDKAGYTAIAERVAHLPAPLAHLFNTNTSTIISASTLPTKLAP